MAEKLSVFFESAYSTTSSLEKNIAEELGTVKSERDRSNILKSLLAAIKSNNKIHGIGVYFEPNAFDGKDKKYKNGYTFGNKTGRLAIHGHNHEGKINIHAEDEVDNSDENAFYVEAMEKGVSYLSEPYYVEGDGEKELVISYTMPIKDDGEIIGIVKCDMDLGKIQNFIDEYKREFDSSYYVLLANDGVATAHSKYKDRVMKNLFDVYPDFKKYFEKAFNREQADVVITSETSNKKTQFVFTEVDIEGTDKDWIVLSATDFEDFTSEHKKNILINSIFYIIIIMVISIVLRILIRNIVTKPLDVIKKVVEKVANFNLDDSEERESRKVLFKI